MNALNAKEELKRIEKEQAKLARKKQTLEAKLAKEKEADAKLEKLFDSSGYKTPQALVKALIEKYNLRIPTKAGTSSDKPRKRTRVNAKLRDSIKASIKKGASMNAASKEFGISYAVVSKIMKGHYDKL